MEDGTRIFTCGQESHTGQNCDQIVGYPRSIQAALPSHSTQRILSGHLLPFTTVEREREAWKRMIFESGRCTLMLSLGSRVSSYKPQSSIRLSVKMRTFNGGCFALNKIFLGFHVLNLLSKGHSCTCQVPTKRSSDFPQCTATTSFDRRWSDSAKAKGVCPAPPSHSSPRSVDLIPCKILSANEREQKMLQNEVYINKIWREFLEIWQPWHLDRWFQKYHMTTSRITYDPIFGIFGTFYELCSHLFALIVPFYS